MERQPPDARHRREAYSIDVEMEIPANVFARHLPWDQLQSWTRLDGTAQTSVAGQTPSVDALRRGAIAFAHKLARASEGFSRHCRLAGAVSATAFTPESLEDGLDLWLAFAVATAAEARTRLARRARGDALDIARERKLVDEYVSVRLLEMLASAERAIAALRESRSPERRPLRGGARPHRGAASPRRSERRSLTATPSAGSIRTPLAPASLEAYIERSSRLKKHFQEVLFLEPETYQVAERLHNWVAVFVALVASTLGVRLADRADGPQADEDVGLRLGDPLLALIARRHLRGEGPHQGDRAGLDQRQRAPLLRAARRPLARAGQAFAGAGRHRASARESFDQRVVRRPDPLSPDSGATMPATHIRYVHRGTGARQAGASGRGVRRVKHIFRYDLSPLFARLDDPVKQVPVFDGATRRVAFTAAPRCYRVAVRLRVRCGRRRA